MTSRMRVQGRCDSGVQARSGFPDHVGDDHETAVGVCYDGSQRESSKLQSAELARALSNLFASRVTASIATNSLQALESSHEKVALMDGRSGGTSSPTQRWRYKVLVMLDASTARGNRFQRLLRSR
jgi:hypothetical protein